VSGSRRRRGLLSRPRSLRTKIIVWAFVPAAIILGATALVAYLAYQQITAEMVMARDQQLTRLAASQLSAELSELQEPLTVAARALALHEQDRASQQAALHRLSSHLVIFDGGAVVLDDHGVVIASEPPDPAVIGYEWGAQPYFSRLLDDSQPAFSNMLVRLPGREAEAPLIATAVPITGESGQSLGTVVGFFRLGTQAVSAFYGQLARMRIAESGRTYLVDANGMIIYHYDLNRVGQDASRQPVVQAVLAGEVNAVRTTDSAGQEVVAAYAPVPGTAWGLVTEESWASLTATYRGYQQFLLVLLGLGLLLPAALVGLGVARLTRPLDRVIAAAKEVAQGNFGQTVTAETGDEVEELARQFNRMSAQLEASYTRLEAQLNRRTRELMALNEIAAVVSRSQKLEEVLQQALAETLAVTGLNAAGIYLLRDERQQSVRQPSPPPALRLAAHQGLDAEVAIAVDNLAVGEGFSGRVVAEDRPLIVANLKEDERLTRPVAGNGSLQALAAFPLRASGRVLGSLFVLAPAGHTFSDEDVELLTSIGHQVGGAVQNARLLQRVQEAATQEERQRLARELHDAVTQTLFSASLISDVLPRIWERSPELGAERLEELRELNRGALAEMRTLLLELRPATLSESSLPELLKQLRDAAVGRQRLDITLDLTGEPSSLPPDVQIAFYRIAQEALNNISKHAQANEVFIRLHYGEKSVSLAVADDGRGFTVADARPDSLGLSIMRERVAQIGADLEIESAPAEGTCISVTWHNLGS